MSSILIDDRLPVALSQAYEEFRILLVGFTAGKCAILDARRKT